MSAEAPTYKLYPLWSIGAAAVGGGVFVGALMIALNYRRLGKPQAARQTIALGMAAGLKYALGGIRTLNPLRASHFKCDSYTSSDTRAQIAILYCSLRLGELL